MKKYCHYTLIFLVLCLGYGCGGNAETDTESPDQEETAWRNPGLDSLIKTLEPPTQTFDISGTEPSEVNGAKGTVIYVDPDALETMDGGRPGEKIRVELKELTNAREMALSGVPTFSGGRMLASAGAYYIGMESEGKALKLKAGKTIEVGFAKADNRPLERLPVLAEPDRNALAASDFTLFYGLLKESGFDWEPGETAFNNREKPEKPKKPAKPKGKEKTKSTTKKGSDMEDMIAFLSGDGSNLEKMTPEQKEAYRKAMEKYRQKMEEFGKLKQLYDKTYDKIMLDRLGWANVDRFYDLPESQKSGLAFTGMPDSLNHITIHTTLPQLNVATREEIYFSSGEWKKANHYTFPIGEQVNVVAIGLKGATPFVYATKVTVQKALEVKLEMEVTDSKKLQAFMKASL